MLISAVVSLQIPASRHCPLQGRFWVYEAENLLTYHDLIYSDSVEGNWGIGAGKNISKVTQLENARNQA